ncbi:MAG: 3-dehydroquinate synthase [Candidatus Peregrinibacteria bacterium Greene0416_19]|nr:MAG: 3-dehydroquinate synthase [Candidatus Peregrinibacteria bacterium Greene0416_19]
MITVTFHLRPEKEISYPILIGDKLVSQIADLFPEIKTSDSVFILHDAAVGGVAKEIQSIIPAAHLIDVASGEKSKSFSQLERILKTLSVLQANRQSLIINVGGGMLTDLGGFVASVYMRGIGHMQVPTTLLGMVDAAIGGKTGIDLPQGKNAVGSFHHPKAILIDVNILDSLPQEQLREGLVEIIKIAAMSDRGLFEYLEQNIKQILGRETPALVSCIEQAVRLKVRLAEEDERDAGKRMFLNFGHTVGHAIEILTDFRISHGKAVSIGMIAEMQSVESAAIDRVRSLLQAIDMPTEMPTNLQMEDVLKCMRHDKKVLSGVVRITVPAAIGEPVLLPFQEPRFLQANR